MPVFVKYIEETSTRGKVILINNYPENLNQDELSQGIILENLIDPSEETGKIKTIYINPQDITQQWSEESIAPKSPQQEIESLTEDVLVLSEALFLALEKIELLGGGGA